MATRVADRVLLDTNVLLAATDAGRAEHTRALDVLNTWPSAGTTLYTTGQILREYLCVATRPIRRDGLGLARRDAVANVTSLRDRLRFLDETDKVCDRLLTLLGEVECSGEQVHDANLVAAMLTHGVDVIVTSNGEDFTRFEGMLTIVGL